jgi:von Willebrand factor type A domain
MNLRMIGPLLAVALLIAACGPADESADVVTVVTETSAAAPAATDGPTHASTPSASPSPERLLEDRYYQDSDGNAVPDFIEADLGYDPDGDDCLLGDCEGARDVLDEEGRPIEEQNTLLILDASGSMAGDDGSGTVKIDAARSALEKLVVGTPDTTNLGLLVYGHRGNNEESGKAESCAGIELFSPLGELTPESVPEVLSQFEPTGWTPIGASLDRAAEVFAGTEGSANRVILVTDGIETCDGDPVASARRLADLGIAVTVDVVGFDVESDADRRALEAIAEASGGSYTDARDAAELNDFVDSVAAERDAALSALVCLYDALNQAVACNGFLRIAGQEAMREEMVNEADGSPREREMVRLSDEMFNRMGEINGRLRNEVEPQIDRLRSAFQEAQRRYEEHYGRSVGWSPSFDCPFDAHGRFAVDGMNHGAGGPVGA